MDISRALVAVSALLLMASVATAPDPRHPLSQITPVDTDLDMENYAINNLSQLQLNNGIGNTGLLLDDYAITHEGQQQKLVLDYQNDEWDIENSNLNLNGNAIQNADWSDAGDLDSSGTLTRDDWIDESGDTASGAITFDTAENDFFVLKDGSDGSNGSPFTLRYDTPREFRLWSNSSSTSLSADHSGNIAIPNGNLDVSGQLSVGSTNCGSNQFIDGDGNCVTDSTGTDSQDLSSSRSGSDITVDITGGSGTTFTDNYEANTDSQGLSNSLDTSPGVGYVEHDIQISGGTNTVTRDYYDPNTDSQDLSSSRSGSDITVDITGGGSTTFTDNYEANTDSQDLSNVVGQGNSLNSGQTLDAGSGALIVPVGTDAY